MFNRMLLCDRWGRKPPCIPVGPSQVTTRSQNLVAWSYLLLVVPWLSWAVLPLQLASRGPAVSDGVGHLPKPRAGTTRPSLQVVAILLQTPGWAFYVAGGGGGSQRQGRRSLRAPILDLSWDPFCDVLSAKGGPVGHSLDGRRSPCRRGCLQ